MPAQLDRGSRRAAPGRPAGWPGQHKHRAGDVKVESSPGRKRRGIQDQRIGDTQAVFMPAALLPNMAPQRHRRRSLAAGHHDHVVDTVSRPHVCAGRIEVGEHGIQPPRRAPHGKRAWAGQPQAGQIEVKGPLSEPAGQIGRHRGLPGRSNAQQGPPCWLNRIAPGQGCLTSDAKDVARR